MKRILSFIFMLTVLGFFGCSKSNSSNHGMVIDLDTGVGFKNTAGQNLLDPATPGYYPHDSIYLFRDSAGTKEVLQHKLDFSTDPYALDIKGLTNVAKDTIVTAYLHLSQNDTDTIAVAYDYVPYPGPYLFTRLWYNGKLVLTRHIGAKLPWIVKSNR